MPGSKTTGHCRRGWALERVVVVQPTTYGRDNACQLEAMAAFGKNARGVMVVDDTVTDAALEDLTARGVCGVRFHMLPGGALPWELLEVVAPRVHAHGWHVQLQLNGRELEERLDRLKALPGGLVVDHVGRFMDPVATDHPSFRALLTLLDTGRCWVKLSAPYESSTAGPPDYADVTPLARALVAHAPERNAMGLQLAASRPESAAPTRALLLGLLDRWVDDPETRRRILVDNPAALYGFGD